MKKGTVMGRKKPEGRMTLLDHLEELRSRIIISAATWIICAVVIYFYTPKFLPIVTKGIDKLVFLSPTEAFMVHLKLAMIGGGFLALPVIVLQILLFAFPGLKPVEKKACYFIVPSALISFAAGAWFSITFILPAGIRFLLSFAGPKLAPMISLGSYVSFVLSLAIAGGIVFELPLVMAILGKVGLVRSRFLSTYRRHAILVILVFAAIITPTPDVFTQILLAGPMYFLFELSIWIVRIIEPKPRSSSMPAPKNDLDREASSPA